jgi:hypothetical protein
MFRTLFPDVDAVLDELVSGVRTILGPRLVDVYLDGSLAIGDFDPRSSDIDFVGVLADEMPAEIFCALQALHERLMRQHERWGRELEGSYVTRAALGGRAPWPAAHPYIDRGAGLEIVRHETGYWVIHRHVLREHGVALVGPAPRTLIEPVAPGDLREAVAGILRDWWRPMLAKPARLDDVFYRCYAVLTMVRVRHTLTHGTVVTKPAAARWALATLTARWHPLIRDALAWSRERPPDLDETLALIAETCRSAAL